MIDGIVRESFDELTEGIAVPMMHGTNHPRRGRRFDIDAHRAGRKAWPG
jgi:hypothetical protein